MIHCYLLQIFLIFLLMFSLVSGRALSYDKLDSDENEKRQNLPLAISDTTDSDEVSYDEGEIQQRSLLSAFSATQSRQQTMDMLQQLYRDWKPPLNHYIPGTRFGRRR